MRRPRRRELRWALVVFGVCALFLLLRWQVIEGYHIPSPSMEPTLRGDPSDGDKVFVNKLAFRFSDPRRWQIVVFRHKDAREGERVYVKRLVGLPGETIDIRCGDLYVNGAIAEKPRDVQAELLFPVYTSNFSPDEFTRFWRPDERSDWQVDDARLRVPKGKEFQMVARNEVRDDYPDGHGGENLVPDLAIEARFRLVGSRGSVSFVLGKDQDRLELKLEVGSGSRTGVLRQNGADVTPLGREPLSSGRDVSVLFWNIDGRVLVEVDGRPLYGAPYVPTRAPRARAGHNSVSVQLSEAGAEFHSLRLSRDIYYTTQGQFDVPRPIVLSSVREAPGYFFLGDNSPNSHDSRHWGSTRVTHEEWIGTPFMVFWPPSRIRLLH